MVFIGAPAANSKFFISTPGNIDVVLMKGLAVIAALLALTIVIPMASAQGTDLYFFYAPGCPHCSEVSDFLDSNINGSYPVTIHKLNTLDEPEFFLQMQRDYDVPPTQWGLVPKVFVGDYYCIGDSTCISSLEGEIEKALGEPGPPDNTGLVPEINYLHLAGLAAVDAVNPCALAVLVILLTAILTRYPKERNKALSAGILFTLSIYLCYFLMGLLIIMGFKAVTGVTQLSTAWFYRILGVFAIILGIFNLKDFFRYGGGGFAMEVPTSWRPRMKRIIGSTTSPGGAFLVGIIVSLFLLPCTAGPYFVAGGVLSGLDWTAAFIPLLIYNVIFVLPMIGITIFVYIGFAEVEHIGGWREKNINRLHLVAGLILLGLGIAMVTGLI